MLRNVRVGDIVLAVFLLAVTAMLLFPLSTVLLDFLLVINLAFAFLLLLAGLYMPNMLALLSFPSLLLLTTLYRLSLNVASTRLILSQGDAGNVIRSFGMFLVSGEVVVGIIIFLIITIVNLVVISRGASRVSEVAARFSLEALPGKQMAIDSDLRSGLVTAEEAHRKRDELRKESQLYGAMDGGMKFVQGDAIAGLFIIVTNIVGGMYMGVRSGLGFSDAMQTYTILTVGDGLVHQIPAILISICAGIVVTRVSSNEYASLGTDVHAQVFKRPGALLLCGAMLVLFGLLPGLPALPFISVGLFCILVGVGQRGGLSGVGGRLDFVRPAARYLPHSHEGDLLELEGVNIEVVVRLDPTYLFPLLEGKRDWVQSWWLAFRRDAMSLWGDRLPDLSFFEDASLSRGQFSISVSGACLDKGIMPSEVVLIEATPSCAEFLGFHVVAETTHPLAGYRVFWGPDDARTRSLAIAGGIRVIEPLQWIGLRVASLLRSHPEEVVSAAHIMHAQGQIDKRHPGLLAQALNRDFINISRLTEVLQQLARERVCIADFKQIVECIALYCSTAGASLVQEGEFDLHDIVTFVRSCRRRHIVSEYLSRRQGLRAISLSPEIEGCFEEIPAVTAAGAISMPGVAFEKMKKGLSVVLEPVFARGVSPIVVVCRSDIRHKVCNFLIHCDLPVAIVTFDEIDPSLSIEPVAIWRL